MSDWGHQLYAKDDPPPEEVEFVLEVRFGDTVLEELRVSTRWSDTAIRSALMAAASRHHVPEGRVYELVRLALDSRDARKPEMASIDRAMRDERLRSRTR